MIKIRTMQETDIDQVAQLEKICFSQPWSGDALRKSLGGKYIFLVAVDEQQLEQRKPQRVLGYVGVMAAVADEYDITNVAVLPEARRQGVGAALMQELLKLAAEDENDIMGITLEVRASNRSAIALYEKFGFKQEGIRRNFYHKPTEDGIIMWKYKPLCP